MFYLLILSIPLLAGVGVFFAFFVVPARVVVRIAGDTDSGVNVKYCISHCLGLFGWGGSHDAGKSRFSFSIGPWEVYSTTGKERIRRKKEVCPEPEGGPEKRPPGRLAALGKRFRGWLPEVSDYRYLAGAAVRLFRALLGVNRLRAKLRFGFGDPALTGYLAGILFAVNGALPERFTITPEWDFTRRASAFDIEAAFTIRFHRFWSRLPGECLGYIDYRKKRRRPEAATPMPQEV